MTDNITPLPNNGENYFRKAMNALTNNQTEKGIYYLKASYELDPKLETFEELVQLYLSLNQDKALKELWLHPSYSFEEIANSSVLSLLYAQSLPLIKANQEGLVELYQLKDLISYPSHQNIIQNSLEKIHDLVSLETRLNQLKATQALEPFMKDFKAKTPFDQLKLLKNLYRINLETTLAIYLEILKDETLFNFVKNDLLHYLIRQDLKIQVDFNWFGELHHLDLKALQSYRQDPAYLTGLEYLEMVLSKNNPHFTSPITDLYNLYSQVYYPFIQKGFQQIEDWLSWISEGFSVNSEALYYYQRAAQELEEIMQN